MSIKQSFTQWLGIEHKVPVMLENKAGKYITYGAFNEYPYYLLDNYRRSSKHNAIVQMERSTTLLAVDGRRVRR
jgi:hypothetical protein